MVPSRPPAVAGVNVSTVDTNTIRLMGSGPALSCRRVELDQKLCGYSCCNPSTLPRFQSCLCQLVSHTLSPSRRNLPHWMSTLVEVMMPRVMGVTCGIGGGVGEPVNSAGRVLYGACNHTKHCCDIIWIGNGGVVPRKETLVIHKRCPRKRCTTEQ